MKYLLIFLVVMLVAWQWRTARSRLKTDASRKHAPKPAPMDMVLCAHCGVHVPQSDVLEGKRGAYCSLAHRQIAEP